MRNAYVFLESGLVKTTTAEVVRAVEAGQLHPDTRVEVRGMRMSAGQWVERERRGAAFMKAAGKVLLGGLAVVAGAALFDHLSTSKHDRAVKRIVREAEGAGATVIGAALRGYPAPELMGGHRADAVIAHRNGRVTVHEVETESSAFTSHSRSQNEAFTRTARRRRLHSFKTTIAR